MRKRFISWNDEGQVSFGFGDVLIKFLILFNLLAFAIETLPDLSERARFWLRVFEVFSIAVFTAEYVLRLVYSRDRVRYATSFFGIVDLLAILPFYLALGLDLRSVRAFRLFRLFQALKLARYSGAVCRFHRAFVIAKDELILFAWVAGIMLYLSAVGIYHFEHEAQPEVFASVLHSLWWAIVTLTTVGYGDAYPVTHGGRLFTGLVLITGLGVVAVPTGIIASALAKARSELAHLDEHPLLPRPPAPRQVDEGAASSDPEKGGDEASRS